MKKNNSGTVAAEIVAGVAAVGAAAAAGYYFYASKNAKGHRRKAAAWAGKMKRRAVREAKQLKDLDAESIAEAIDTAVATYQGVRSIKKEDLRQAANELKANWKELKREVQEKSVPRKKTRRVVQRKRAKK